MTFLSENFQSVLFIKNVLTEYEIMVSSSARLPRSNVAFKSAVTELYNAARALPDISSPTE